MTSKGEEWGWGIGAILITMPVIILLSFVNIILGKVFGPTVNTLPFVIRFPILFAWFAGNLYVVYKYWYRPTAWLLGDQ